MRPDRGSNPQPRLSAPTGNRTRGSWVRGKMLQPLSLRPGPPGLLNLQSSERPASGCLPPRFLLVPGTFLLFLASSWASPSFGFSLPHHPLDGCPLSTAGLLCPRTPPSLTSVRRPPVHLLPPPEVSPSPRGTSSDPLFQPIPSGLCSPPAPGWAPPHGGSETPSPGQDGHVHWTRITNCSVSGLDVGSRFEFFAGS